MNVVSDSDAEDEGEKGQSEMEIWFGFVEFDHASKANKIYPQDLRFPNPN
jgi:hypothetical protein